MEAVGQRVAADPRKRILWVMPGLNEPAAPTELGFVTAGNQFQLNWLADHTGWQLQSQTNSLGAGLGTNWVNVGDSMQTNQMTVPSIRIT
jgi:hypothetical protein